MSFEIKTINRDNIEFIQLINNKNNELVEIIPSIGGAVNRIKLDLGDGAKDILRYDSDKELKEDLVANAWFRGRILFPFNDMIPDGKYKFNGKEHQLYINIKDENFALHGFQYTKNSITISTDSDDLKATVILTYLTDGTDEGYPFKTNLQITYTLSVEGLKLNFKITNESDEDIPLALGWHPYYKLSGKSNNWILKMSSESLVEVDKDLVPTGNKLPCKGSQYDFSNGKAIEDSEIDLALSVPADGKFELTDGTRTLRVQQDPKYFKYIQMYTPDDRESIAIEPVTAATNSFNFHNLGLITLKPNEKIDTFVSVLSS